MTKEEIMIKHCSDNGLLNINLGRSILAAMEEYAQQQVKILNISAVSSRRELLIEYTLKTQPYTQSQAERLVDGYLSVFGNLK